jgi:hypothetical protein
LSGLAGSGGAAAISAGYEAPLRSSGRGKPIASLLIASTAMRRELLANSWAGQVGLVAMILVTAAVGFCLFDGDQHGTTHHGMSIDLCAGLAILSVAVTPVVFAQVHPVPVDPPYMVYAVFLHRLDPPPKSPSLS